MSNNNPQEAVQTGSEPVTESTTAPPQRPFTVASLYVGDLAPSIGESNLYDFFKDIGPVTSIRVCRDHITRQSLGYAYVNFHTPEVAAKALEELNGTALAGKTVRICWSKRDPSERKSNLGNVYVRNLSKDVEQIALLDIFKTFGSVQSCKLQTDENGRSKGFGYVHFSKPEDAERAITFIEQKGVALNDKVIYATHFRSRKDREVVDPETVFTNVYIKNLPPSMTDEELIQRFSEYGSITSGVIMRDDKNNSKGFGFVNYDTHEQAVKCVTAESQRDDLYVARAQPFHERRAALQKFREDQYKRTQGMNLYIKNLDSEVNDEDLRNIFAPIGKITSAKVMTNEKGASKNFGFVCFSTSDEAKDAIAKMSNFMFRNKPLYVAFAQRRENRNQYLQQQYANRRPTNMPPFTQMPYSHFHGRPGVMPVAYSYSVPVSGNRMMAARGYGPSRMVNPNPRMNNNTALRNPTGYRANHPNHPPQILELVHSKYPNPISNHILDALAQRNVDMQSWDQEAKGKYLDDIAKQVSQASAE